MSLGCKVGGKLELINWAESLYINRITASRAQAREERESRQADGSCEINSLSSVALLSFATFAPLYQPARLSETLHRPGRFVEACGGLRRLVEAGGG